MYFCTLTDGLILRACVHIVSLRCVKKRDQYPAILTKQVECSASANK